jgi:thioredoxin-related protein
MIRLFFILIAIFTVSSADSINIDKLLGYAKKSHKHVLIFLHKPHCSYCENMIEFTLPDEKIAHKIKKNFIFVDIDIADSEQVIFDDFNGSKHEFAKTLGFDFYPSAVFIDEDEEVVYGQAGYKDEDKFLKTLRFVESRAYRDMGIDDFK